jgi:hypothetical protein
VTSTLSLPRTRTSFTIWWRRCFLWGLVLERLMKRFGVYACVIDGLSETPATRAFAGRHGSVFLNFFNDHQRGSANWTERATSCR